MKTLETPTLNHISHVSTISKLSHYEDARVLCTNKFLPENSLIMYNNTEIIVVLFRFTALLSLFHLQGFKVSLIYRFIGLSFYCFIVSFPQPH